MTVTTLHRSWGSEFFTQRVYDPSGTWRDTNCRCATEAEAAEMARRILTRIIQTDPRFYKPVVFKHHIRTWPSVDRIDCQIDLTPTSTPA